MHRPWSRVLAGGIAGLAATVPMSVLLVAWHRRLPWMQRDPAPPAQITERILVRLGIHDDVTSREETVLTMVNHFGYGTAMGAAYGILTSRKPPARPLASGIAFGVAVWGGSYLGLLPTLGLYRSATDEPARRNLMMLAAHVVWGGTLGLVTECVAQPAASESRKNAVSAQRPPNRPSDELRLNKTASSSSATA